MGGNGLIFVGRLNIKKFIRILILSEITKLHVRHETLAIPYGVRAFLDIIYVVSGIKQSQAANERSE